MEFGYFEEFPHRPGRSPAEDFDEGFALAEAAERGGLDAVWLAELHCAPNRSVLAAPLTVASSILARTRRIKVGTAVQVLPLGDPFRMAEESATIDQVSRGRLLFGAGRSSSPRSYDAYGIPYAESRERFDEALEIIIRAWTEPTFSYHGRFYEYENVCLVPKPYQHPHPPVRVAINSADNFPTMGRRGLAIFGAVRLNTVASLVEHLSAYRVAWHEAGHPGNGEVYLRIPVYIADTPADAIDEPRESLMHLHAGEGGLVASLKGTAITYDEVLREKSVVGTVEQVTERLRELRELLGLHGVLAELNPGGLIPPERVARSMRLLCERVVPAFR